MTETVHVDRNERVAIVTLDRPQQLNAIGTAVLEQLDLALASARDDDAIGAVVVTGAGRAFSAGADIAEFGALERATEFREWIRHFTDTYDRLERFPKPTIAAVDGVAFGGGFELVLACDLRVASTRARFGLPEVKLGLLPGGGGTQRLVRTVPLAIAKHMILTGDPIGAEDALRFGLVNEVVEEGRALDVAVALARTLAAGPAEAMAAAKQLLHDGSEMSLEQAVVLEGEAAANLFESSDAREGVRAFLDKRPARFGRR